MHSPSIELEDEGMVRRLSISFSGPRSPQHAAGSHSDMIFVDAPNADSSLERRRSGKRASISKENRHSNLEPSSSKRIKLKKDARRPFGEVSSTASTAASTPSSSPLVGPLGDAPMLVLVEPAKVDYSILSIEQLRDQLGVTGTDIVVGWEKDELISALETLEQVIADMPSLEL